MITLITLLISLLGYGSPVDFENFTEVELNNQIEMADGGHGTDWEISQ